MADGFLGVAAPMVGGGNPYPFGKPGGLESDFVGERAAGGGEERIYGRFVYHGIFRIAFALDSPIVAHFGFGHEVDARVRTSEVFAPRKVLPQPHLFKLVVAWVCQQP